MARGNLVSLSQQTTTPPTTDRTPFTALLRAIADKLIPGIPEQTRVSILQQTNTSDANTDDLPPGDASASKDGPTVLEDVVDKATAKSDLEQEINSKCVGHPSQQTRLTPTSALRRRQQHRRLRRASVPAETPPPAHAEAAVCPRQGCKVEERCSRVAGAQSAGRVRESRC